MASALPRLMHETELQKMLTDEKMRSEKHRTNYETLKTAHARLQDAYIGLERDLKATVEEYRLVKEKYEKVLEQSGMALSKKNEEFEMLKTQVLDPKKMELLKLQVQSDLEKSYREKFDVMSKEMERNRNELSKLKYEYSFLKSEYEHDRQEHQSLLMEISLRHEAEVTNLRKERENMLERQQKESSSDSQHLRAVQKENIQLNLKVKSLLSELEEIRAQREQTGLQADSITRLQVKQMTELQSNLKAIETERQSLKTQCDNFQRELTLANDHQSHLMSRMHELEKENIALKNRADEVTHKSKLDMTNIRMGMLQDRGELDRERDRLTNCVEDLRAEIEILKQTLGQHEAAAVDKEKEVVRKIQGVKEEEWQKIQKLETEKMELETKLQEMEKRKIDTEAEHHQRMEQAEEQCHRAEDLREQAEKEAITCRNKLQNQQMLLDELEHDRLENNELKARLQRLETQYSRYVEGERDLVDLHEKLEREADQLRVELQRAKESTLKEKDQTELVLVQSRTSWMEEKSHLQSRLDDLETQLAATRRKLANTVNIYKQKKNLLKSQVFKFKEKLSQQKLKIDVLQTEKEALRRSIPSEAHEQLKRQLRDLLQRNMKFKSLLLSANIKQTPIGGLSFGTMTTDFMPAVTAFFDTNQKELSLLRDRLDIVDSTQRHQLDELKGNSALFNKPSTAAVTAGDKYCEEVTRDKENFLY